jgi:hypothetical protein
MKIVDVDPDNMHWPACCCRCGSKDYGMQEHEQKIVTSSLLALVGVVRYKVVTLTIPVCKACAGARGLWYSFAALCAIICVALFNVDSNVAKKIAVLLPLVAMVCVLVGGRKRPLRVLGVNEKRGTIRLKVYNDMVGAQLRRTVPSKHAPIRS